MLALSITNLRKNYDGTEVLKGISLDVKAGEFFGFLGPNGAGKTTTINCVTGLASFNEGTVKVFGKDVVEDYRQARKLIGLAPQDFNIDIFRTCWEVLIYNAGYFGIEGKEARERAKELLMRFGLWEHRKKPFAQLSGGMKRRLTLARALIHKPRLLILDEPTAGVDVELRISLWQELKKIQKEGVTIFLTTHYLEEAERLCERIAIIHRGQILLNEKTEKILKDHGQKRLEEIFINLTHLDDASTGQGV